MPNENEVFILEREIYPAMYKWKSIPIKDFNIFGNQVVEIAEQEHGKTFRGLHQNECEFYLIFNSRVWKAEYEVDNQKWVYLCFYISPKDGEILDIITDEYP
jgi:hypothetical protein